MVNPTLLSQETREALEEAERHKAEAERRASEEAHAFANRASVKLPPLMSVDKFFERCARREEMVLFFSLFTPKGSALPRPSSHRAYAQLLQFASSLPFSPVQGVEAAAEGAA